MNYKESITALLEGLKGIFENKTATEAQAIAYASTKPSTIFYTSDTHAIVVGGKVYGRSNQVSADAPFSYLPADVSSPSADPQFDVNHDTIYIQPIKTGSDAGKIKLWWYVNGAWTSTDTLDLVLPTEAEDITYDLTATPDLGSGDVQSAIEALDGKVEDLRDEVLGDEWENIPYGARRMKLLDKYQLRTDSNGDLTSASNYICYFYELKGGEEILIQNVGNYGSRYRFYNTFLVSASLNDYVISDTEQIAKGTDTTIKAPTNAKMLVVSEPNAGVINEIVNIRHKGELSIADKTGYKIDTWTDDEIITSTTLAVGSIVPYWYDGTRYGARGVRLNVKEGDKVLLDTYSPALFGLIFTDENRVVKALYDDRRFDGVWTAPVNGYCYIQDVLYRDCYHYSSAHGHLAYMAHDARKRVAKGGDWYNELAPKKLNAVLPFTSETTPAAGGPQYYVVLNGISNSTGNAFLTYYNALNTGKMQYKLVAVHAVIHEDGTTAKGSLSDVYYNSTTSTLKVHYGEVVGTFTDGDKSAWTVVIKHATSYAQAGFGLYFSCTTGGSLKMTIDKVFVHTSSDFGELYQLAQKIINGEVEVDNFYGVREKEVDFVRYAIGLQSISDLGYNILEHGATLPIDEEGYKYAKEIYEKYKDNPPTGNNWYGTASPFNHDTKLVYLPQIDFSKFKTSGTDYLGSAFNGCTNLVCAGDITLPEESTGVYANFFNSTFLGCYSLKQVGNIQAPMNKDSGCYRMFYNCYAIEKVGKIIVKGHQSSGLFGNCYSLERIEEIVLRDLPYDTNGNTSLLYNCVNLRYMLGKELGTRPASGTYMFNYATLWGIPNDKHPDARQSLVDSLLTYSYDRVNDPDGLGTAGTTCTITLSANSYAQLTASEIEAITAKGYTLTHP